MSTKIIITGVSNIDQLDLAKHIVEKNDNLSITPHFTTNEEYSVKNDNYLYYLDSNVVNLSYKNNSLLITNTENFITSGVTIDDFYNNDILCTTLVEFNNIIENCFNTNEILIIWLDTSDKNLISKNDIRETKYLCEKLDKGIKYLYFLNENINDISDIILQYISGNDDIKLLLLEKYS